MLSLFAGVILLVGSMTPTPIIVNTSGYSCEDVPQNPMRGCHTTRSGEPVSEALMACDYEEMGQVYYVQGIGVRRCADTGRFPNNQFDLYFGSYTRAKRESVTPRYAWRLK